MNQYFDFTSRQLKCLSVLCATAMIMGGFLFVRSFSHPDDAAPPFSVFIGENEQKFTGLFVLDPNTAPADSLELLPGVGRVLADRIIEYRQHYRFKREIDVTEVKGIGPRLFERIKPYLKVASY